MEWLDSDWSWYDLVLVYFALDVFYHGLVLVWFVLNQIGLSMACKSGDKADNKV